MFRTGAKNDELARVDVLVILVTLSFSYCLWNRRMDCFHLNGWVADIAINRQNHSYSKKIES